MAFSNQRIVTREEQPEIFEHIDKHVGRLFRIRSCGRELSSEQKYDNDILVLIRCELRHGLELYYLYDLSYWFLSTSTNKIMYFHREVVEDFFETFGTSAQYDVNHYTMELIEND